MRFIRHGSKNPQCAPTDTIPIAYWTVSAFREVLLEALAASREAANNQKRPSKS